MNMQESHSVFYPGNDVVLISSATNPQSETKLEKMRATETWERQGNTAVTNAKWERIDQVITTHTCTHGRMTFCESDVFQVDLLTNTHVRDTFCNTHIEKSRYCPLETFVMYCFLLQSKVKISTLLKAQSYVKSIRTGIAKWTCVHGGQSLCEKSWWWSR